MKLLYWLKDHWYLPLFAVAIVVAWFIGRRSGSNPIVALGHEVAVINAGAEARKLEAERGTDAAKAEIELRYKAQLAALTAEQKKQAEALASSPVDLARFLVRAGGGNA